MYNPVPQDTPDFLAAPSMHAGWKWPQPRLSPRVFGVLLSWPSPTVGSQGGLIQTPEVHTCLPFTVDIDRFERLDRSWFIYFLRVQNIDPCMCSDPWTGSSGLCLRILSIEPLQGCRESQGLVVVRGHNQIGIKFALIILTHRYEVLWSYMPWPKTCHDWSWNLHEFILIPGLRNMV